MNDHLKNFFDRFHGGKDLTTLVPLLPLLFNMRGRPLTLKNHYPFEPLFSTHLARSVVLRTGRQVGKTASVAIRALLFAVLIRYFRILFVTPLHEQILRLSNDHVRPLIEESPFRSLWFDKANAGSVLRRELRNYSTLYFSYAFLSAERIRSFSGIRMLGLDECQDVSTDFLPIILETLSAAEDFTLCQYTGTSKTRDNTLEWLWQRSSQAEWVIRCQACNFYNIPAVAGNGGHLEKMIGPYRDDISEERPGLICAKCGRPIFSRTGRWIHRRPDLANEFAGYHVPQPIMPTHFARADKWKLLLWKQSGGGGYGTGRFFNEVLGEPHDFATKLINLPDIQRAACLHVNDEPRALEAAGGYIHRVLAVDWGGGGEKGVSFTAIAVLGMLPNGVVDVIYGKKLLTPHDHLAEARECRRLFREFNCELLAHDYTGAGEMREAIMVHNGMPREYVMPIAYIHAGAGNIINYKPATPQHPREYWTVDKTRSLQLTCYAIKFGRVRLFHYDWLSPEEPGLLHDFLALIENKVSTAKGSDLYTIQRDPNSADDFAQAVNIGCCAMWHLGGVWPDFAGIDEITSAARTAEVTPDEG